MQVMAQELGVARLLAALGEHRPRHVLVVEALEAVEPAAGFGVGDGFDVEREYVHKVQKLNAEAQRRKGF